MRVDVTKILITAFAVVCSIVLVCEQAHGAEYSAFADSMLPSPPISRYALVDRGLAEAATAAGATVTRVNGEYHVSYPMRDVPWDGTIESLQARYGPNYPGFRRLCRHIPHVGTGPEVSAENVLEWAGYQPTSQGVADLEATCSPLYSEYIEAHPDEVGVGRSVNATCDLFGLAPGPAPSHVLSDGDLIRVGDLDRARMCCWSAAVNGPFSAPSPPRFTAACTEPETPETPEEPETPETPEEPETPETPEEPKETTCDIPSIIEQLEECK